MRANAAVSAAAPAVSVVVQEPVVAEQVAEAEPAVDGGKDDAVFVLVARVRESHEQSYDEDLFDILFGLSGGRNGLSKNR